MRYLSLEALSHLATSDLSREAVKKHQDIVMKALNVRAEGRTEGEGKERDGGGGRVLQNIFTITWMCVHYVWEELLYFSLSLSVPQTERDVSVRQRAIDLLYAMCDHANAQTIVEELLRYLEKADYSIRETLVCVCVCVCVCVSQCGWGGEAM